MMILKPNVILNCRNFILVLFLGAITNGYGQSNKAQKLSLLFVGDVMQHDAQLEAALNPATGEYEYDTYFEFVSPLIRKADIAIANLEVTLPGPPYSGYPQFGAPDALALSLKHAGFDYLLTANNHSCDKGLPGIYRTLDVLDSFNIPHTGTFRNRDERDDTYPLLIKKNGFTLALLNYTYGTNGLEAPIPSIVNMIDTAQIKQDLTVARKHHPDMIIVAMHWGKEYKHMQNKEQEMLAELCFANGADMVIGGHPHVLQPMEKRGVITGEDRGKFVAWSLGNFVSNQRRRYTNGGCMLWLDISKSAGNNVTIDAAGYVLTWVYVDEKGQRKKYYILPAAGADNIISTLQMDSANIETMQVFIDDSRQLLNTHNINVPELLMDSILARESNIDPGKPVYRLLLVASESEKEMHLFPLHLQSKIETERTPNNLTGYYVGRYISMEVAEAFRNLYSRSGFRECKIVTIYEP